jgi:ribosomal protein S18 acetylase RimI-like enzyme
VTVPPQVVRFWGVLDDLLASVVPTRWGAVVTDARFPAIWDANYARIDGGIEELTAGEVERQLLPALRAAGADVEHVVAFDAAAARRVVSELSARGHRLSWDLVMALGDTPRTQARAVTVEPVGLDDAGWRDIRASLAGPFGIDEGEPLDQLMRLEREVLAPAGKRWFGVRVADRWVSVAALVVFDGVAYVDNVATDAAFRGRGFASAVTRRVVDEARRAGVATTFLLADPDEEATVRLYERLGFHGVARLASMRGPLPSP